MNAPRSEVADASFGQIAPADAACHLSKMTGLPVLLADVRVAADVLTRADSVLPLFRALARTLISRHPVAAENPGFPDDAPFMRESPRPFPPDQDHP
jgi:hypothetical protein